MAEKEDAVVLEGTVVESLKGKFKVKIVQDGTKVEHFVLAHLAGKMRQNFIKIVPGDKVDVEVSPYDLTRGRIVFRRK